MPPTWIEPPPKTKRSGCLGKGCIAVIVLMILLAAAFFVGGYVGMRYVVTSTEPKQIPQIETTEADQTAVQQRWDDFTEGRHIVPPIEAPTPPTEGATPTEVAPPPPPPSANRIELTAGDINQLIAGSRKLRGKGFVSIQDNVAASRLAFRWRKPDSAAVS